MAPTSDLDRQPSWDDFKRHLLSALERHTPNVYSLQEEEASFILRIFRDGEFIGRISRAVHEDLCRIHAMTNRDLAVAVVDAILGPSQETGTVAPPEKDLARPSNQECRAILGALKRRVNRIQGLIGDWERGDRAPSDGILRPLRDEAQRLADIAVSIEGQC